MINWNEYMESRNFLKHRCNICREWFDEKEDIKIHLIDRHSVRDKFVLIECQECKEPFVRIYDEQKICGRKDCIVGSMDEDDAKVESDKLQPKRSPTKRWRI